MDDLFLSLMTPGHGTHTRNRPDAGAGAHAAVGAAFGATFDAMLASDMAAPAMTDAGSVVKLSGSSDGPKGRIESPEGQVGGERPLTLPPNEAQPDGASDILGARSVQPDDAADTPTSEPKSATNIAINAQFADAGSDATRRRSRSAAEFGPLTLPTADTATDSYAGQTSGTQIAPQPANSDAPEHANVSPAVGSIGTAGTKQTGDVFQVVSDTDAFDQKNWGHLREVAGGADSRTTHPAPPNTIPPADHDGPTLPPNTIPTADPAGPQMEPATIPPADRPRVQGQPNTIPPADEEIRPQTIPPADRKSHQLQPNTIPTSDQSDVQMRPNTIPPAIQTSIQPQPNTIPTAAAPIANHSGAQSLNSASPDTSITARELSSTPLIEPAPLNPSTRSGASSQVDTTQLGVTTVRLSSTPVVETQKGQSGRSQTTQPVPANATATATIARQASASKPAQQLQTTPLPQASTPAVSTIGLQTPSQSAPTSGASDTRGTSPIRTGGWTIAPSATPTPTVTAPMSAIMQAPVAQFAAAVASDAALDTMSNLDFTLQTALSGASTTALTPAMSIAGQAPSATAQVVAQQIATALSNQGATTDAPLELALDPPELGRVRMQIAEISGVMTLMIQAERPETADLMRRHLELLAQEFAQASLDAPSVHISHDGAGQGGQSSAENTSGAATASPDHSTAEAPPHSSIHSASGGLDLRL